MAVSPSVDALAAGRHALETARWSTARTAFEEALTLEPACAEAREGHGLALWFLGDVAAGIAEREAAFDRYASERRCSDAARVAVWVSHQHQVSGRASAARGWLARAERAVEQIGLCPGQGWVAVERARHAASVEERISHAERALRLAQEHDESDLEVLALSVLGRAEVDAGRAARGMLLLEEAMAAATAGRVRNVHALVEAYCNLIVACAQAGDSTRAAEWCEHVADFAREHGTTPLLGTCRTIHADVLVAAGRWTDAEESLREALELHARHVPAMGAATLAALAELRVRQGRMPEAGALLAGREEHPESLRALAHLRLAQGRPRVAIALLERGLLAAHDDAARIVQLLPLLVDAQLSAGEVGAAEATARRLRALAGRTGGALAAARASLATARVLLREERREEAAEAARSALTEFGRLRMPLETGEAGLELARAIGTASPGLAREEARVAHAGLSALGATRAADSAAAILRSLGTATGGRSRVIGDLTSREREVLHLVSQGMSNAEVARTLFISAKTAGHHVSRILSKLGVRNRAEAAALATREMTQRPATDVPASSNREIVRCASTRERA